MKTLFAFLATMMVMGMVTLAFQPMESEEICTCLPDGVACPEDYHPVCGLKDGRHCTFTNMCNLGDCPLVSSGSCVD